MMQHACLPLPTKPQCLPPRLAPTLFETPFNLTRPTGKGGDDGGERAAALHQHLLVEFALSLLQGALRKGIINPRSPGAGGHCDAVELLACLCPADNNL